MTGSTRTFRIPDLLIPYLTTGREWDGSPATGYLFPTRRGLRWTDAVLKAGVSLQDAADMTTAFGLHFREGLRSHLGDLNPRPAVYETP